MSTFDAFLILSPFFITNFMMSTDFANHDPMCRVYNAGKINLLVSVTTFTNSIIFMGLDDLFLYFNYPMKKFFSDMVYYMISQTYIFGVAGTYFMFVYLVYRFLELRQKYKKD